MQAAPGPGSAGRRSSAARQSALDLAHLVGNALAVTCEARDIHCRQPTGPIACPTRGGRAGLEAARECGATVRIGKG